MHLIKRRQSALVAAHKAPPELGNSVMHLGDLSSRPLAGDELPVFTAVAGSLLGKGTFGAVRRGELLGAAGEVSVIGVLPGAQEFELQAAQLPAFVSCFRIVGSMLVCCWT